MRVAARAATGVVAIVPHWNRRDLLESLFASFSAQTLQFDEVIVVDNGSSDGSVELAESLGARVIALGGNLGFAVAVNRGIEACDTEWVAILNNDVTLDPDWLAELMAAAGQASFATGKLLRADDPVEIDGTFDEISRGACAYRSGAGKPDSPIWNQPRKIRFAPMTAALFRRSLFEEVGPLDETFGSYLEDVDFGIRCAIAGREGIYEPRAVAQHRGSATLGRWTSDTVKHLARNQILLTAKYFRGQPLWPVLAGQLLWGLVALRHARGGAYLSGKVSGLRVARSLDKLHPSKKQQLSAIFSVSEKEILELERQTGFSWYWRAYFWLSRW